MTTKFTDCHELMFNNGSITVEYEIDTDFTKPDLLAIESFLKERFLDIEEKLRQK